MLYGRDGAQTPTDQNPAMSLRERFEIAATALMAACALTVTGIFVRTQFSRPPDPTVPHAQKEWRTYAVSDMRIGAPSAPVVITEFSDFQCPFCLRLYQAIERARKLHPDSITIVYRNYPLRAIHPFAGAAAIAAECAAQQRSFESYYSYLFEHRDSLGAGRWVRFAKAAGVSDTSAFAHCLDDSSIAARLRSDSLAAEQAHITGTPMFFVNDGSSLACLLRRGLTR